MSVAYIETFKVLDTTYGIEDYKDGRPAADHFFPDQFRTGERKRFAMWRGGCGFGQRHSKAEAMRATYEYIERDLRDREHSLRAELSKVLAARAVLGDEVLNLRKFRAR